LIPPTQIPGSPQFLDPEREKGIGDNGTKRFGKHLSLVQAAPESVEKAQIELRSAAHNLGYRPKGLTVGSKSRRICAGKEETG